MQHEICAATRGMNGGRLSLSWDHGERDVTFVRDQAWFWVAYDKRAHLVIGSGRAATLEAAVEQAIDALSVARAPAPNDRKVAPVEDTRAA